MEAPSNAPPRVACIGEAMVELALDDVAPDVARVGFAGDTLNTAVYLKRALPEAHVAYVTRLGTDRFSERMISFMQAEGLATDLVGRSHERVPGLYAITTDRAGERSFTYWRDRSAARQLFEVEPPALEDLAGFDLVFLSAISLAIMSAEARAALLEWLPAYRAGGGRLAFDSNWRPALWPDRPTARAIIEAAWRQTDIALPSLDDELAIFGERQEGEVLARLREFGVRSGALKRGAAGPLALDGTPAGPFAPATRVIDSTAAGDSFNAAYLAARLRGLSEAECLAAGHALAARVVGARGAILPREETG
ncbi:2-dehydro-3-deoxygluconokinase [Meinhardsimonia xiamenensis]|jgi:2-dehydro-3-deoxygluconokinase|uniref:2-dehydro-3-deoxygluconokinase n=2 Tax=Meinhardsimonia xiamenensis TaxID=990712 RepID=A0A1G9E2S2_9RHOB|nr:2-dehydro-3-deoxygluconokinase [Meinhardsimonia xiamenensis]SDK70393.1 2-dehydro-3-deoxygluconokinase [Meinhardsimonia xiamenensis]